MSEDEMLEALRQRIADAGSDGAVDELLQMFARLLAKMGNEYLAIEVIYG